MIILIGGASHTGKTLLAQRLLEKHHFPYLSIDHLKMGLIRSGNTSLTPLSDDVDLTNYLWPIVREMIKTAIENNQNLIVEGCYVPFDFKKDFEKSYLDDIKKFEEDGEEKRVCAACDTYALPGFQGVTPLEYDCKQCGECYLNLTGGICPLTACSKGLVNGQCGGAKNGKCEVDCDMECGWERIQRRLEMIGRLDALKCPVQVRNYATDDEVSK